MAIDWKALRREYEKGSPEGALANKYNCSESEIRARVRYEKWERPCKNAKAVKRTTSGAPRARRKTRKVAVGPPVAGGAQDEHLRLWGSVKQKLENGLLNANVKTGLEELKVAKVAGEVLASVIKGERLALGYEDAGVDEAKEREDALSVAEEMDSVTAPPCSGAAVGGE